MVRLLLVVALVVGACRARPPSNVAAPTTPPRDTTAGPPRTIVLRDTAREQRAARLELRVLEKEAEVEELQARLDDARREVVRAMAKLQSLATRAEAASGMAEAGIALHALRLGGADAGGGAASEIAQAAQLLQLASDEFNRRNYAGALYLATQAKNAAAAGQARLAAGERGGGAPRSGEVPFTVPLRVQTTTRANLREGPGQTFAVGVTLESGVALTAYSYVDQWVRVRDESGRTGWIHQGLIARRADAGGAR